MSLARIRDQESAVQLLGNILRRGRFPNAMLFWGPDGVGKYLTALEFAKAIHCTNMQWDACDTCPTCEKIEHGNHPDVRTVVPMKRSRSIANDVVEEITEAASLSPTESDRRIFILQDADRMTARAQGHFLKTLEEPPGKSLFILTTQYPGMLFVTIRSRCQSVRFRALRTETIVELLLQQRDIPHETAHSIAALAQGQMTQALDLVDTGKRVAALGAIRQLTEGADPVQLAQEFAQMLAEQRQRIEADIDAELQSVEEEALEPEERERIKDEKMARVDSDYRRSILQYLYLFETWYRDELVYEATGDLTQVFNHDQKEHLKNERRGEPAACIRAIEQAQGYLQRNISEDRVFRLLFLKLAGR